LWGGHAIPPRKSRNSRRLKETVVEFKKREQSMQQYS